MGVHRHHLDAARRDALLERLVRRHPPAPRPGRCVRQPRGSPPRSRGSRRSRGKRGHGKFPSSRSPLPARPVSPSQHSPRCGRQCTGEGGLRVTPVWVLCRTANRARMAIPPGSPRGPAAGRSRPAALPGSRRCRATGAASTCLRCAKRGRLMLTTNSSSVSVTRSKAAAAATEAFDLHAHVNRLFGTDLHRLDPHTGIGVNIALLLFSELVPARPCRKRVGDRHHRQRDEADPGEHQARQRAQGGRARLRRHPHAAQPPRAVLLPQLTPAARGRCPW